MPAAGTQPPRVPVTGRKHLIRQQLPVTSGMPLGRHKRILAEQRTARGGGGQPPPYARTGTAIAPMLETGDRAGLPFMPAVRTQPPHVGIAAGRQLAGQQRAVAIRVPLDRQIRARSGERMPQRAEDFDVGAFHSPRLPTSCIDQKVRHRETEIGQLVQHRGGDNVLRARYRRHNIVIGHRGQMLTHPAAQSTPPPSARQSAPGRSQHYPKTSGCNSHRTR